MSRTALLVTLLAAALAATASPARAADISAGAGCSVQCIETALLTPTASGGTLRVRTSVPASVKVSVVKVGAIQLAAPGVSAHASVPSFLRDRTIVLTGLQPETSYRIVVTATDLTGKTSSRVGAFKTRSVQVANPSGVGDLASDAGCSARCIQRALVEQSRTEPGTATVDIRTSTPATLRVRVTRGGALVDEVASSGRKTAWLPTVDGLEPGTTYGIAVRATDTNGLVEERSGSFRTAAATVRVTLAHLHVIDDADKGSNRGEIRFWYRVNGSVVSGGGRRKIGSGSVLGVPVAGTSRPGLTYAFPVTADTELDLRVRGDECDRVVQSWCDIQEAGGPSFWGGGNGKKEQWAAAAATFDPGTLRVGGDVASPGWRGSGVSAPPGHDAVFSFETTSYRLKLRVLAYADVEHHFEG